MAAATQDAMRGERIISALTLESNRNSSKRPFLNLAYMTQR
jgi:hypothetical protein